MDEFNVMKCKLLNLIGNQDFDTALTQCNLMLDKYPKCTQLFSIKGSIYMQYEKYTTAMAYFRQSLISKFDDVFAIIQMSECLFKLNNIKGSLLLCDFGLLIEPKNTTLLYNKAVYSFYAGKHTQSLNYFNMVIDLEPEADDAGINKTEIIKYMSRMKQYKNKKLYT